MNKLILAATVLLTMTGCSNDEPTKNDTGTSDMVVDTSLVSDMVADRSLVSDLLKGDVAHDGGPVDARVGCPGVFPLAGPTCCNSEGGRSGSADCAQGQWSCEGMGTICLCDGAPQMFSCVDVCGSDIMVEATCEGSEWVCAGIAPTKTSDCPDDLCWGDYPGLCCDQSGNNATWSCVDGSWEPGFPCQPENC